MGKITSEDPVTEKVLAALQDFLGDVPSTREKEVKDPLKRSRKIAVKASAKAATVSGTLALPPGPLGMLTVIPDIMTVWKIQAQMVADIAGTFGKQAYLSREQMLYCLFQHTASRVMRDIVVRAGGRMLVHRVTLRAMENVLVEKVGVTVTQRMLGKSVTRWFGPLAALGIAGYAYYDTAKVAQVAVEFFESDIVMSEEDNMIFRH